jgi:hypothetical protein
MIDLNQYETDEFETGKYIIDPHYNKIKRFQYLRKYKKMRLCNYCYNRHCHDSRRSYFRSWKLYRKTQYRKYIQIRKINLAA